MQTKTLKAYTPDRDYTATAIPGYVQAAFSPRAHGRPARSQGNVVVMAHSKVEAIEIMDRLRIGYTKSRVAVTQLSTPWQRAVHALGVDHGSVYISGLDTAEVVRVAASGAVTLLGEFNRVTEQIEVGEPMSLADALGHVDQLIATGRATVRLDETMLTALRVVRGMAARA